MALFTSQEGRLIRRYDGETLWIEPWGENALRVRASYLPEMPQQDWALLAPAPVEPEIRIEERTATIVNGKIRAEISEGGCISFYDGNGNLLLEEQWRTRDPGHTQQSSLEIRGREFRPILGGDYKLTMRFEPNPGEKIFGMGQYQDDCLDKSGCSLELAHRNSQASVPFYVSSKGYGFLWHNPAVGRATFGRNVIEWRAEATRLMDYYIVAGDTPGEILHAYADATGHSPMMPDYGMGFWQCKLRYRTQEELLQVLREHKKRGLPLDVIVVDFFHWPMQGDWRFDETEFPDPEAMIREVNENGAELMVSIWPYVDTRSENYPEMLEKGYLARVDRGVRYSMDYCGNTIPFDATNPEACKFVWSVAKRNYFDKGVRLFWLDEAEPECKVYDYDLYRYQKGPVLQVGNIYPLEYARTFFEGMQESGMENPMNLLRCAWAGNQRYGALVWSGDIDTTFQSLRSQLSIGLSMGMAGIPWWTTDIGGFLGGDQDDPDYRELMVRWFQFGAFCPVMRLHGYRLNREDSANPAKADTGGPNEVWSYGEEVYQILRKYMFLREEMRPYISSIMKDAAEAGAPVIRPLFFDFHTDAAAVEVTDQYMFGPDVLVAPILELGMRKRKVYLPKGETWIDLQSGAEYCGGQTIVVDAPLEVIPVFERKGGSFSSLRRPTA